MSDSDTNDSRSESGSQIMSEDSTTLLIEALEIQLQEMILKNEELMLRIEVLQNISDSEIINKIFSYL